MKYIVRNLESIKAMKFSPEHMPSFYSFIEFILKLFKSYKIYTNATY